MNQEYDIVLANGKIVDGSGNPWFWGDLAVQGGRIAVIATPGTLLGSRTIDVGGRYITPGFIDIHTHSDLSILINRRAESMVRQGVTTNVIGNCGMSPAPVDSAHLEAIRSYWEPEALMEGVSWEWRDFASYLKAIQDSGIGINIAALVGHGALRIAAMSFDERAPSEAELQKMKALTAEAMQAGAFGLSTGLVYPPGCFAATEEIVALCEVAASYSGIYTSHIRGERETILDAVAEAIQIGRAAKIPVQISHNAPKIGAPCDAHANLRLVEEARAQGLDVTVDNDVHTDLAPALFAALPQRLHHYAMPEIQEMLKDSEFRKAIHREIREDGRPAFGPAGLLRHDRWKRIILFQAPNAPQLIGCSIDEIAAANGKEPFDAYCDLIIADGAAVCAIFDYIAEENIRILLQHPAVMICSDGAVSATYGPLNDPPAYAPCSFGEFPGVLERYVRERGVLSLEQAISKMTSFPAQKLKLFDRGILRPGAWADILVFDLERVHDRATNLWPHAFPFENYPHLYPEGIDYVLVNGQVVVEGEAHTGALAGRLLRKQ